MQPTGSDDQQKQTSSLQQTSQADFLSGVPPSLRRTSPVRVVTTQSAGGAIHTKFCSSSDSEPDELPSSAVTAAHRESTGTVTSPLSKQPPPSGVSKGRRNREAEEPLRQGQEEGTGSHGETGTKEEEDKVSKEPSGRVEPALGTVRDYTTLPELHGAPRGTLLMCLDNVSRCALV